MVDLQRVHRIVTDRRDGEFDEVVGGVASDGDGLHLAGQRTGRHTAAARDGEGLAGSGGSGRGGQNVGDLVVVEEVQREPGLGGRRGWAQVDQDQAQPIERAEVAGPFGQRFLVGDGHR